MFYQDRGVISTMLRSQNDQRTPTRWKSRGLSWSEQWKNVARLQLLTVEGVRSYPPDR